MGKDDQKKIKAVFKLNCEALLCGVTKKPTQHEMSMPGERGYEGIAIGVQGFAMLCWEEK